MKKTYLLIAALVMTFSLLTFSNVNATPRALPIDSHGWFLVTAALAIGCIAIIFKMKKAAAQSHN